MSVYFKPTDSLSLFLSSLILSRPCIMGYTVLSTVTPRDKNMIKHPKMTSCQNEGEREQRQQKTEWTFKREWNVVVAIAIGDGGSMEKTVNSV